MTSNHILTAAILAFSAGAYAQTTPDAVGAQQQAQPPHQHRYVTIGRDRTKVHLDRPAERSRRGPSAMGNSGTSSASPAAPPSRGEDLKGGPN